MDMEIFPHRLLGADTTEKLWNDIYGMKISKNAYSWTKTPSSKCQASDIREIYVKGEKIDTSET